MNRSYSMHVTARGIDPKRVQRIKRAANGGWKFDDCDWCFSNGENDNGVAVLTASADGNLCGGETEEEFAERMAKAIWAANGGYCLVEVVATCLEDLPCETYSFDEEEYARILWPAGKPAETQETAVTGEEGLQQDLPTNWPEKVEKQARDCILSYEDDFVQNLGKGYVVSPRTRENIERWIDADNSGGGLSLLDAANLLDQLDMYQPAEWFTECFNPCDAVANHANLTFTAALRSRIDAMLEDMEDADMDDATEDDDFRAMVQRAAGKPAETQEDRNDV